ncbi:MAG TPA: FAD-binding protein, partial [Nitrospirota bacterium]
MEIKDFKGELKRDEPLSRHTSFAIGGPADVLAYPVDRDDLALLLQETRRQGRKYFIIGGGTNLLVRDGGFRGVLISLQRMNAIEIEREYRSVGGIFAAVKAQGGAA